MKQLALVALLFGACVHAGQKTRAVRQVIEAARAQGAYVCAPVDLAKAEAHADFADAEFIAGNHWSAKSELALGDEHARRAIEASPRGTCNPGSIVHKDTDGDGVPDDEDQCPAEPEDKDAYLDADGCPDPDNDSDGILDEDDKCPDEAGPKENGGCPDADKDGDGVVDRLDKCPTEPGPKENDGCPDKDRDGDGVVDRLDRCPDLEGPADNAGCPTQKFIVVTKDRIELKQKVHFATDMSKILSDSFAMLNEIGEVLKTRLEVKIRIEGHTDTRGSLAHNMKLSQARADSVRTYLVGRGIEPARVESRGFGPTQPIADNRTAAGREQNRRVEFIITAQ